MTSRFILILLLLTAFCVNTNAQDCNGESAVVWKSKTVTPTWGVVNYNYKYDNSTGTEIRELKLGNFTYSGTSETPFTEAVKHVIWDAGTIEEMRMQVSTEPLWINFYFPSCWEKIGVIGSCNLQCCCIRYLIQYSYLAGKLQSYTVLQQKDKWMQPVCASPCFFKCNSLYLELNKSIVIASNTECSEECYWKITGNSNIDENTNFIGPTNGHDFIIKTLDPNTNQVTERVRVMDNGQVGIYQKEPLDALHIGSKMTFHIGANQDFIGYNDFMNAGNNEERILDGVSQKLSFDYQGSIYLGLAGHGRKGDLLNFWEDVVWGSYRGIAIRQDNQSNPHALIGLGINAWDNVRVNIGGFNKNNNDSYALQVRGYYDMAAALSVTCANKVGIGTEHPVDILQVGSMINFHDGANTHIAFNSYWNGTQRINFNGDFASMQVGADANGAFIDVDKKATGEEVYKDYWMLENYKGIRLNSNGNIGIAHPNPQSRIVIHGENNDNTKSAMNVMNFAGTSLLFVRNDGNIGIGTETPKSKLHVKGNVVIGNDENNFDISASGFASKLSVDGIILAKEIKVTTSNWADFVFNPEYKLLTLDELETYISTNKHLPNVPTAEDVKSNGVNISEMQAKLLMKVEELTLYMIEMKKENEKLKNEIQKLKEQK